MKKFIKILFVVIVALMMTFGSVAAKQITENINGLVTEINGDLVTVETQQGDVYEIHVPSDFELSTLLVGDQVNVKAEELVDGTWQASFFKVVEDELEDEDEDEEEEDEDLDEDEDEDDGAKALNAAFCDPEKQDKPHPLAVTIAARYDVTEEWVMEHYCNGDSMGAIMLALKTSAMEGVDVDADTLLETRSNNGGGWGQLWQDLKLIGKDKETKTPPGQLKKQSDD